MNREFLESLPKEEKVMKISVKPVEKLIEPVKLQEENAMDLKCVGVAKTEEVKDVNQRLVSDLCQLPKLGELC